MSLQLRTAALTSDEILKELITDSLPSILGESFEIISASLPFDGNHILALNGQGQPAIIAFDCRDGGRALLSGLGAIEGLGNNRAMLYRLYPGLFRGARHNNPNFRIEGVRLIVLSTKAPPGGIYLAHAFPALSVYLFRILEVDGKIGLLIENPRDEERHPVKPSSASSEEMPFRTGRVALTAEEECYFQQT